MLIKYLSGPANLKLGKYVFVLGKCTRVPDEIGYQLLKRKAIQLIEVSADSTEEKDILPLTEAEIIELKHSC